jgi:hypothetical protein
MAWRALQLQMLTCLHVIGNSRWFAACAYAIHQVVGFMAWHALQLQLQLPIIKPHQP